MGVSLHPIGGLGPPLPVPRSGVAGALLAGRIFVLGGEKVPAELHGNSNTFSRVVG